MSSSKRSHASAARSAAPRSPASDASRAAASRILSDSPNTSTILGTSAHTHSTRVARSSSRVSSAIAAAISSASVIFDASALAHDASAIARFVVAVAASAPARVDAHASARHIRLAASALAGPRDARSSRRAATAVANDARCVAGSDAKSDLTLPWSMLAPKYCTDGSSDRVSAMDTSHASFVSANATRKSFAFFCATGSAP